MEDQEEQEKRNSPAQKNWEGVLVNISSICGFDTVFVFRKINVTGVLRAPFLLLSRIPV